VCVFFLHFSYLRPVYLFLTLCLWCIFSHLFRAIPVQLIVWKTCLRNNLLCGNHCSVINNRPTSGYSTIGLTDNGLGLHVGLGLVVR